MLINISVITLLIQLSALPQQHLHFAQFFLFVKCVWVNVVFFGSAIVGEMLQCGCAGLSDCVCVLIPLEETGS